MGDALVFDLSNWVGGVGCLGLGGEASGGWSSCLFWLSLPLLCPEGWEGFLKMLGGAAWPWE